jgi:hypothetical protein
LGEGLGVRALLLALALIQGFWATHNKIGTHPFRVNGRCLLVKLRTFYEPF